eukprot:scaffold1117_cov379-Prasinococcus_capsulatus_cf.AAC.12
MEKRMQQMKLLQHESLSSSGDASLSSVAGSAILPAPEPQQAVCFVESVAIPFYEVRFRLGTTPKRIDAE